MLGSVAGFFGAVVMLWLVGTPVGMEVNCCPSRLLEVGMASSKGWMEELLDGLAFSDFPVAVKPSTRGLENVAARKGLDVEA